MTSELTLEIPLDKWRWLVISSTLSRDFVSNRFLLRCLQISTRPKRWCHRSSPLVQGYHQPKFQLHTVCEIWDYRVEGDVQNLSLRTRYATRKLTKHHQINHRSTITLLQKHIFTNLQHDLSFQVTLSIAVFLSLAFVFPACDSDLRRLVLDLMYRLQVPWSKDDLYTVM